MKKSNILNIILAAGILCLAARIAILTNETTEPSKQNANMEQPTSTNAALECIMTRASVREFTSEKITDAEIETLLKAGMAAPTALDKRPWHFYVATDSEILSMISECAPGAKAVAKAGAAIIICGDSNSFFEGDGKDFWIEDCSAAAENILLAAHAIGLGAVWNGVYPIPESIENVKKTLDMEQNLIPMCIIAIGHPLHPATPKDKWNPNKVTYLK